MHAVALLHTKSKLVALSYIIIFYMQDPEVCLCVYVHWVTSVSLKKIAYTTCFFLHKLNSLLLFDSVVLTLPILMHIQIFVNSRTNITTTQNKRGTDMADPMMVRVLSERTRRPITNSQKKFKIVLPIQSSTPYLMPKY